MLLQQTAWGMAFKKVLFNSQIDNPTKTLQWPLYASQQGPWALTSSRGSPTARQAAKQQQQQATLPVSPL
jgi:hypothetical protein